jgi:hypothetical protein
MAMPSSDQIVCAPPAERRQDHDPPVAELVPEPLDHDPAVRRQRAGHLALVGEV